MSRSLPGSPDCSVMTSALEACTMPRPTLYRNGRESCRASRHGASTSSRAECGYTAGPPGWLVDGAPWPRHPPSNSCGEVRDQKVEAERFISKTAGIRAYIYARQALWGRLAICGDPGCPGNWPAEERTRQHIVRRPAHISIGRPSATRPQITNLPHFLVAPTRSLTGKSALATCYPN
jgi:hypothetical protein